MTHHSLSTYPNMFENRVRSSYYNFFIIIMTWVAASKLRLKNVPNACIASSHQIF